MQLANKWSETTNVPGKVKLNNWLCGLHVSPEPGHARARMSSRKRSTKVNT